MEYTSPVEIEVPVQIIEAINSFSERTKRFSTIRTLYSKYREGNTNAQISILNELKKIILPEKSTSSTNLPATKKIKMTPERTKEMLNKIILDYKNCIERQKSSIKDTKTLLSEILNTTQKGIEEPILRKILDI